MNVLVFVSDALRADHLGCYGARFVNTSTVDELYGWRSEADTDPFPTLARILGDRKLLIRRLAYDLPTYYLSVSHYPKLMGLLAETRTANLSGVIDRLRYRRSPAEIAYVRRSAAINDIGVEACTAALAAGKSELEVAGAIHQAMMAAGAGSPAPDARSPSRPR